MISKFWKWAVVVIVLISLGLFIFQSDMVAIKANLSTVGYNFVWLIFITFICQVFGTLSWRSTMPQDIKVPFWDLFLIRYIGEHIGLINPTNIVGGDVFKAYYLERKGIAYKASISSLLVSRMIMIYTQVFVFLLAAFIYLMFVGNKVSMLYNAIGISVAFIILTIFAVVLSDRFFRSSYFSKRRISEKINKVRTSILTYYQNQKGRFLMAMFWSVISFLLGAVEILLICDFIGVQITYLEAVVIDQGVLFLKSFAAFIPGQIGVEEYINKLMLTIVGITSMSVWISVSILRRARQIFWIILGVVVYYIFMREKSGDEAKTFCIESQ